MNHMALHEETDKITNYLREGVHAPHTHPAEIEVMGKDKCSTNMQV